MKKEIRELLMAAKRVVGEFDDWGEVLQTDDEGEYGPDTAIERLRAAVSAVFEK
jgi:hypothetical protein